MTSTSDYFARCRLGPMLCSLILILTYSGCSRFDIKEQFPWVESKPRRPTRLTALWTPTVLNQTNLPGIRGFGGRVYFYDGKGNKPIRVDGTLTVFAFDDTETDHTHDRPSRKFIFPAENLSDKASETKIGQSYSFWLPWDEVGGEGHEISLITRFESKSGTSITSNMTTHTLAGDSPADTHGHQAAHREVEQVSHEVPLEMESRNAKNDRDVPNRVRTITIPQGFSSTFRGSPGAVPEKPIQTASATFDENVLKKPLPEKTASSDISAAARGQQKVGGRLANDSQQVRFPARRGASFRPTASRARMRPIRSKWPSGLPKTPRYAPTRGSLSNSPSVPPPLVEPFEGE